MPLLKRKRFPLLPPPPYDPEKKESRDRQVWYSPITAEIFTDYPTYLERTALYKQPIWQSEATGRSNLTYKQALENERIEKERVQDKIPEELQRRVLAHAQFHTGRLDAVVDSVYNHFTQRFCPGEIVNCRWDDGIMYNARILKIIDGSDEDHVTVPTTNGETNSVSTVTNGNAKPTKYVVQLIDENSEGLEDFTKTVTRDEIKRDRLAFSKNLLKKFIRENMSKDSYNHAPWIIKPAVAKKFGLDTELPPALEAAKEFAFSNKQKKKTNNTSRKTIEAKMFDAAKLEASLKYPMEDLDLPMYRRDPSGAGPVIDMAPGRPKANATVPNPTGGLPPRPKPTDALTVPAECFGSFLMIWSFLTTFSRPLGLSPFSLDDFENALRHDDVHFKSQLLIESNVCLLNAIIRERQKMTKSQSVISLTGTFGSHVSSYHQASPSPTPGLSRQSSTAPSSEEEPQVMDIDVNNNSMEQSRRASLLERGCGSDEIVKIGRGWDAKAIPPGNDRVGWEDIMIGCINDIASPEMTAELDRIFNQLVPHNDSTLEEREAAYLGLGFRDKVTLMEILTNAANECSIIKEYMEECQEQLTELRKQKIELSRERKRIYAEREELERREGGGGSTPTPGSNRDTPVSESDALSDTEDTTEREEEIDESTNRRESRRATLKRKQAEREEREAKRLKRYHQQREEARLRNQEQRMRNAMRKRLDEEERHLHKKEEQLEHNMRKFSTLRIKMLGRDKFFNRYIYMDNIGGAAAHGTGKLFVQSPSEADLMVLRERNDPSSIDNNNPSPCGHGGGTKFVCELMAAQGMAESACEFLRRHLDPQPNDTRPCPTEWWEAYQDPEDLDKLLDWLNPKGIREYRLRKEIEKQKHNMITGMRKKVSESHNNTARSEMPRRSTRSKTVMAPPVGSWLAYTNKLAR